MQRETGFLRFPLHVLPDFVQAGNEINLFYDSRCTFRTISGKSATESGIHHCFRCTLLKIRAKCATNPAVISNLVAPDSLSKCPSGRAYISRAGGAPLILSEGQYPIFFRFSKLVRSAANGLFGFTSFSCWHPQGPSFRFAPHVVHKPLQSSVHNGIIGTSKTMAA